MQYMLPTGYREVVAFGHTFHLRSDFTEERLFKFLTKVDFESDKATGCWRWIGASENGYGRISTGDRYWFAHRLAWVMLVGQIDPNTHLHHLVDEIGCIGPNCVNPYHLEPLSPEEHVLRNPDNITMVRANSQFCERGHELTTENVYIRPSNGSRQCKTCRSAWNARQWKIRNGSQPRIKRTHCKQGHLLEGDNVYEWAGQVYCRQCHNKHTLDSYHAKRVGIVACSEGHPYSEYGGVGPTGKRYCKECIRLRDEKIRQSKVVDGVECCKHGHPRTPENTYLQKGTNRTLCRVCLRISQNKAYDKRKLIHAH